MDNSPDGAYDESTLPALSKNMYDAAQHITGEHHNNHDLLKACDYSQHRDDKKKHKMLLRQST